MTDLYAQLAEEDKHINQMIYDIAVRYSYSFTKTEAACKELISQYPFSLCFIVSLCWLGHATLCTELEIILAILVSVEDKQAYEEILSYLWILK